MAPGENVYGKYYRLFKRKDICFSDSADFIMLGKELVIHFSKTCSDFECSC